MRCGLFRSAGWASRRTSPAPSPTCSRPTRAASPARRSTKTAAPGPDNGKALRADGVLSSVTSRVHYAWVVAGVAFLALVLASGFRSTTGVLLIPLHEEFGWSHETIGLAVSLNLLCFGLGAPFAAALVERLGMRRVVGAALAVIAVSSLLTVGMTQPWQLFLRSEERLVGTDEVTSG